MSFFKNNIFDNDNVNMEDNNTKNGTTAKSDLFIFIARDGI